MTICERLFEMLGDQRGKQEQLAKYLGVAPTVLTNWKEEYRPACKVYSSHL